MAAWKHWAYWTATTYPAYRKYVGVNAPAYRGRQDLDCADMSLTLLIEFAAANGLPVTLTSDDGTRFISKGTRQTPTSYLSVHSTYKWKDKDEFLRAVINRLNAKSVFSRNTTINRAGPEPGDLMCKTDHVALVYKTYPPGVDHPQASDTRVPIFPGPQVASRQLNQTEYFRADHSEVNPTVHFDYLNHRGEGTPVKQKAELIYFADAMDIQKAGFEFRLYNAAVLDNWTDWNGEGDPPR
jgi:hypothetical protein